VQNHRCDFAALDADPKVRIVARPFRHAKIGFGRTENIGKSDHTNVILRDDDARAGSPQLLVGGFDDLLDEREYPFLPLSQRSTLQAGKLFQGLPLGRRLFFRPLFLRHSAIPRCGQSAVEVLAHPGDIPFLPSARGVQGAERGPRKEYLSNRSIYRSIEH
jgi:hypothetical protein